MTLILCDLSARPEFDESFDDIRVGDRRRVSELIDLAYRNLAEDATHDLAAPCFRQAGRPVDDVGGRERTNLLPHTPAQP
jgi:hypothetical protein